MKTDLKIALKQYGIENFVILKKMNEGYINNVWLIRNNENKKLIIKQRDVALEGHLEENIKLVEFLKNKGFPIINLIPNIKHKKITKINNYYYELTSFINGGHPEKKKLKNSEIKNATKLFQKLDYTLSNLPKILLHYPNAKIFTKKEILSSLNNYKTKLNNLQLNKKKILHNFIHILERYINKHDWNINNFNKLPRQVTHGNLSDNNILLNKLNEIVGIIDWDNIRIRPRIHSISQQALTFSGPLNSQFITRFVFYIGHYYELQYMKRIELENITPYMHYRNLNSIWIFDHILNYNQIKSYNAIPKIIQRLHWFEKNRDNLQNALLNNIR